MASPVGGMGQTEKASRACSQELGSKWGSENRGQSPPRGLRLQLLRRLDMGQLLRLPTWPRLLPAGDCLPWGAGAL